MGRDFHFRGVRLEHGPEKVSIRLRPPSSCPPASPRRNRRLAVLPEWAISARMVPMSASADVSASASRLRRDGQWPCVRRLNPRCRRRWRRCRHGRQRARGRRVWHDHPRRRCRCRKTSGWPGRVRRHDPAWTLGRNHPYRGSRYSRPLAGIAPRARFRCALRLTALDRKLIRR